MQNNRVTQIGEFSFFPDHVLGQGSTGHVYQGIPLNDSGFRNYDKMPIAVKAIRLCEIDSSVKSYLLENEVAAFNSIRSQYVC